MPSDPDPQPPHLTRSRLARALWAAAGAFFVLVALIGVVLPILPTTPFLILAAACFSRASQRWEAWLLAHPRFGPLIRNWRERGAIPVRAKCLATLGMVGGFALFLGAADHPAWRIALVAAFFSGCLVYVLSRPSR